MSALGRAAEPTLAEKSPEPAPPPVTLPEPVDTPIEYPEGEERSAEVVLELTIDAEGSVTGVSVIHGEPPFAEHAAKAAARWRFVPAERAGRPLASRIRYTVRFEPPVLEPSPEGEVPSTPKPAPAAPANVAPTSEVVVRGVRPPPGSVRITREEARAIPGTFGDPLRAVEAQPGVVPIVSGLPSFFVRGAPPGNVGFFIDGVDVPLLYHAFFGPSVVHPGLIESVELYSGAAPVEYGRFAGPIVAATASPLERRFGGQASVRLIDAGVLAEVPFGGCEGPETPGCSRGSVRAGGRYAYTGLILSQIGDAELNYWDYQGQLDYALGPKDNVGFLAFGAYDFFRAGGEAERNGQQGGGEVMFHRLDLRWDHRSDRGRLRVALTGGLDSTGGVEAVTSTVKSKSLRVRTEYQRPLADEVMFRAGADARVDDFTLETDPLLLNFQDYSRLFPDRTELTTGAYTSFDLELAPGVLVVPGVRADLYSDGDATKAAVDPRVSAEVELSRRVTALHSFGILHQKPNFVPQVPAAQVADLQGGLQQALLWSSGVRVRLPESITATANVFRTAYLNALDPLGGERNFSIDRTVVDRRAIISSAGLELELSRSLTERLGGFVAYTLSRTVQSRGATRSISGFDRPHVVQAALAYDFGSGYTAGARGVFYSGVPEQNFEGVPHFVEGRRGRPYFRADLRGEKRFRLSGTGYLSVIAEILNATSTTEVVRLDCGERCVERVAGPVILPSVGVEAGF